MTEVVDPYLDAEHGCLRNLLEITDARRLAIEEAAIVAVRLRQLDDRVDVVPTTVGHWRSAHRHLFGDVYSWAGEFRTVDITKGAHPFHPVSHLYTAAAFCSQQMLQIAHLDRPDADTLVERSSTLRRDPPPSPEWYSLTMSGTHTVVVGDRGRIVVPAEVRARGALVEGTPLVLLDTPGGIVLLTREQLRARVRDELAGLDLIGELLDDRRRAAEIEDAT